MQARPEVDDAELDRLAARARSGDLEAYAEVVRALQDDLRRFLAARCYRYDLVEEVLQESLVAGFESLARYQAGTSLRAWFKGIARHHLLRELRRQAQREVAAGDTLRTLVDGAAAEALERDDEPADERRIASLRRCLETLAPRARRLLVLHHLDGEPLKRLAQRFSQAESALRSALRRIRDGLRRCVGEGA